MLCILCLVCMNLSYGWLHADYSLVASQFLGERADWVVTASGVSPCI